MLEEDDIEILRKDVFTREIDDYNELIHNKLDRTDKTYNNPQSLGNIAYLLIKRGIILAGAILDGAKLSGLTLNNISFKETTFRGADFSYCNLSNINFSGADLSYAKFDGSILKNIDFRGTNLEKSSFLRTEIDNKTTSALSESQYWETIKINDINRAKINRAYGRAIKLTNKPKSWVWFTFFN